MHIYVATSSTTVVQGASYDDAVDANYVVTITSLLLVLLLRVLLVQLPL